MAVQNYEDQDEQQSADEATAWHDCRMLRQSLSSDPTYFRVLIVEKSQVIDDFITYQTADGLYIEPSNPITSMTGDRVAERNLRSGDQAVNPQFASNPFLPGKDVRFNLLTRDLVRLPPRHRQPKNE